MRSKHFFFVLVAFAAIAVFTAVAPAFYHPTVGRFINRDPNEYVDGLNLYNYTGNNPILLTDPMGGCSSPPNVPYCKVKSVTLTKLEPVEKLPGFWSDGNLSWPFDAKIEICGDPQFCKYSQHGTWRRHEGGVWQDYITEEDRKKETIMFDLEGGYKRGSGDNGTITYHDTPGISPVLEEDLPTWQHDSVTVRVRGTDGVEIKSNTVELGPHSLSDAGHPVTWGDAGPPPPPTAIKEGKPITQTEAQKQPRFDRYRRPGQPVARPKSGLFK